METAAPPRFTTRRGLFERVAVLAVEHEIEAGKLSFVYDDIGAQIADHVVHGIVAQFLVIEISRTPFLARRRT